MLNHYNIYKSDLEQIDFSKSKVINTINPHSYCVAKEDQTFEQALKDSDILLPDGIGVVWAERFLNRNSIKKIAGYDLFIFLMNKLELEKGSVFFLGSSEKTLNKIMLRCKSEYPKVKFGSYSPPFKDVFSEMDSKVMCDEVNEFKPDVLFIGMTAPKQEKWSYKYQHNLNATLICSVGAVFDFYAGNITRSSSFWINLGLEWFPRLIKDPKRLFWRNFGSTPKFILETISFKLFGRGIL